MPAKAAAAGAAALLVLLCVAVFQPQSVAGTAAAGSPAGPATASGGPVGPPQNVIVVLKDGAPDPDVVASDQVRQHGPAVHVKQTYHAALKGYSATVSAEALDAIKHDPRVKFVSADREVHITDIPTGVDRIDAELASGGTAFAPTPSFAVAVLDTGIELAHPDLNAVDGINCITAGTPAQDDNGHGTHVAGIIGAKNDVNFAGVAPGTKLIAVKVLDTYGSGLWSQVICGIDWVTANAAALNIKVANMSLAGFGIDDGNCGNTNGDAFHQAICRSVAAGVTYVVAAGNNKDDLATYAPATYNEAITVTALADYDGQKGGLGGSPGRYPSSLCPNYGPDDTFASFSNYPSAADIGHTVAAPGTCIYSTYLLIMGGDRILSGTSMASPHVAGVAALYIESHPGASPAQVLSGLKASGEALGAGHTDPSGLHPEPVVNAKAAYSAPAIAPAPSPTPTATPAPSPSGDAVPPAVVISQPSNGVTVTAGKTVVIAATASDNVGMKKVEFWLNGARKCSDTAAPYSCNWSVPNSAGITYSLVAKAYDAAGNMGSQSISVVSGHDITPPTVGIASPPSAAGVGVGTTVALSALASDDVGVTKVEFWVNGSRKCSDTAAPYTCNWKVPTTPGISYTIEARAYDASGNVAGQSVTVVSQ